MKQTIKTFRSPIGLLKVTLLAGLFTVSSIATFSGFFDMINQSDQATILKIAVSMIFTLVVQASILYFAMQWWTTRVKHHLLPLCLAIFVSVIFSWGFYFNLLNLDKTLTGQIYAEFLVLVFAILINVLIFMMTIVLSNSTPPASFSSWSKYFSNSKRRVEDTTQ